MPIDDQFSDTERQALALLIYDEICSLSEHLFLLVEKKECQHEWFSAIHDLYLWVCLYRLFNPS